MLLWERVVGLLFTLVEVLTTFDEFEEELLELLILLELLELLLELVELFKSTPSSEFSLEFTRKDGDWGLFCRSSTKSSIWLLLDPESVDSLAKLKPHVKKTKTKNNKNILAYFDFEKLLIILPHLYLLNFHLTDLRPLTMAPRILTLEKFNIKSFQEFK